MLNQLGDYYRMAMDGQSVLTKFLDIEEIKEVKSLQRDGLKVYFEGGYQDAERLRAIIQYQDYPIPDISDYKIKIYHATYNLNYQKISHRNVLGSIMSLGIERNTFGDIYLYDNNIYLFVSEEIAKYLISNMPNINNQPLIFTEVEKIQTIPILDEKIVQINVASFRLDSIVAKGTNVSRNKAVEMIESGQVAINHLVISSITHKCAINDIISIRKFGRIRIIENVKTTKKDRLVIKIGVKH